MTAPLYTESDEDSDQSISLLQSRQNNNEDNYRFLQRQGLLSPSHQKENLQPKQIHQPKPLLACQLVDLGSEIDSDVEEKNIEIVNTEVETCRSEDCPWKKIFGESNQ